MNLKVREIAEKDIQPVIDYWLNADPDYLEAMGVDLSKMPTQTDFEMMLQAQLVTPYNEKESFALIWECDGEAVGHTNVNKIKFGDEAYMHLHLWNNANRQKGIGSALVKLSLPLFFEKLQLKTLYCEPYAHNPAPNRALEKIGFEFVKQYRGIPGILNSEQDLKLWKMEKENLNRNEK